MVSSSVDILEEIWFRLPVRSLLVFKCVSKQWCALISDPCFCRRYSVRNHKQSVAGLFVQDAPYRSQVGQTFFFIDGSKRNNAISNTFVPYEKSLPCIRDSECQTIQSCNGLLCCRTSLNNSTFRIYNPSTDSLFFLIGNSFTDSYTPRPTTFYVYNPTTNRHKILAPPPSRKEGFMSVSSVSLAFDPQKSPYYEAIAIWGDTPDGAQAEIYSSKSESWKDLGVIYPRHANCFRDCGVYWNGALHWFNIYRGLYFDIGRKLLKTLPVPGVYGESIRTYRGTNIETWNVYFGECNGHLHVIKTYGLENIPTNLYILELERDYSAWTVKYIVNIEHLTAAYKTEMVLNKRKGRKQWYFKDLDFSVLFVEDNDDDEAKTSKLVMHIGEHVIFYNLKDMSFKEVEDVHLIRNAHNYHRLATPFIESLACV